MTASTCRTAQKVVLALIGMMGTLDSGVAAGLTAEQCYKEDSCCTQFCAPVTGEMRYECFQICDRMLNNCLDTGEWRIRR